MALHFRHQHRPVAVHPQPWDWTDTLRFLLLFVALLGLFGFGLNRYFDYRLRELDKRLEQIK